MRSSRRCIWSTIVCSSRYIFSLLVQDQTSDDNVCSIELQCLAGSSTAQRHPHPFKISSSRVLTPPNTTPSSSAQSLTFEPLSKQLKGKPSYEDMGHSSCVIHSAFYTMFLLLYSKQDQAEGRLSLRIGEDHNLASGVLGNAGQTVAYVVASEGLHELVDVL